MRRCQKASARHDRPPHTHTHSASIDCAGKAERLNSTPKSLTSARAGRTRWRMDATCAREVRAQGRHARESPLRSRLAELARCAAENVPRDLSAYPQCRAPSTASCSAVHGVGAWDMGGTRTALSADGARGARGGGERPAARARGAGVDYSYDVGEARTERCLGSGRRAGGGCRVL